MIFNAARWLRDAGILGMNRRNAEYIMQYNRRSAYPLVDDKLLTKRLAEEYGIPTPPVYHVVEHHGDIAKLKNALADRRDFVVKPARGAGGSGIVLIAERTEAGFVKQGGEVISWTDLTYHISDILSGIYSLGGLEDRAFIEGLIYADPVFAAVNYNGVPDIRIVAYRGVPVMGMLRLPTQASDGKANLHRGAIGVGIDISRGTTLAGVYGSRIITHHPDTGNPLTDISVPHWEMMLAIAARASDMTKLGYLGVDLVIDRERGPLLLEMNARPGLQIQIANRMGLRRRLELVEQAAEDIFETAETRVSWARKTFPASAS
jgi:alpha-L-glutamate ligase-like protein